MCNSETFDILDEFKKCIMSAPLDIKSEFEYWCLGKNSSDVVDISLSLDEYIDKIRLIVDGAYDKNYNYVTYVALNDSYNLVTRDYYNIDYSNALKGKMDIFKQYNISRPVNGLYSCFITTALAHSKPKLTFRSLEANCCFVLVAHDRFKSFDDFTLLKTAAYWNEYLKKIFKWSVNYGFLFKFINKKQILLSEEILTNDEFKRYKINNNNYTYNSLLHNLIYEKD